MSSISVSATRISIPPEAVKERLLQLASADIPGKHMYMPNAGYPETRAAVAAEVSESRGVALTADQIVMTCGAGGALNVIFKTLLDPGEEVIIPAPFFVEYRFYVDNAGGVAQDRPDAGGFFPRSRCDPAGAITEKTKAVLINSPNNPTGKVYDEASIRRACGAPDREEGRNSSGRSILISDEPYSEIVYDGLSLPSVMDAYPHSFIASSYSKSLSLPGERIGYIAVNPAIAGSGGGHGGAHALQPDPRLRECPRPDAAGDRRPPGGKGRCGDLPEEAGPSLRRPRLGRLPGETSREGAFYLFLPTPIADDVRLPMPSGSGGSSPFPGAASTAPAISGSPTAWTMRRYWARSKASGKC